MMWWSTLVTLLFQGLLVSLSRAEQRICYVPSGAPTNDVPCSSDDGVHCCPEDTLCLENGICYDINGLYMTRGSCTDKRWESGACPNFCKGEDGKTNVEHPKVLPWGNVGDERHYCCDRFNWNSTNLFCYKNSPSFPLGLGRPIVGRAALKGLGVTAPEDIKINRINTSYIPDEYQVKSDSGKKTAIGAGVGVSLGVVALASLAWAFWLLKQNWNLKKSKARNPEQGKDQFQGQMGYGGQSGIMMPSGGHMSPESPAYTRVEQMEMHENPSELQGMPKRGP